jgi:hypothetical protein
MKRASISMTLAVTLAAASFAPATVAAPRCIMDLCCPKGTTAYSKKPKPLVNNWTAATPCCKAQPVDVLACQARVAIVGKKKV